ncbi:hypothetical protein [Alicyclobacillus sendaiensis]|uniref:hypothetical protein n=1 Tax=Alicyclobacillus sendaiensis TaxID=192387 RepID=UPI0026F43294|nr:hypothetical protein [Alicyclobacillus sendaiensis]
MAKPYQPPVSGQKFSDMYPMTKQGVQGNLVMDMALPIGGVNNDNLFGAQGTGTTNATVGTTQVIYHNLGVVPNVWDIQITPMGNGVVYLDPNNPPTATTFNVLGSAASLQFAWKIITNGPGNQ